ncbi:Hypothetical protein DEACI_2396 [Acididesulfobacillus acetoxydans]|uniref:Uncharacterized protein n=1 Tax=Acididesulfobacillus acetoxydans TaxID=1561005 RepID=A0A8S0W3I6_9FIRM|nr:hypothetical protein [Acididesulfobacillus acetoxydans]CAA7601728.1 Hypothetical protein DEACI_2396 [Acididesulfobacillus acetoxydans]CEJ09053.1 Hypothetical protein DEACI_3536 [Acididesulfobacillus acetoxydans]
MKMAVRILKEIFDFFCGDWRVFWGIALTVVVIEGIEGLPALAAVRPWAGLIFFVGVALSLVNSLQRETKE